MCWTTICKHIHSKYYVYVKQKDIWNRILINHWLWLWANQSYTNFSTLCCFQTCLLFNNWKCTRHIALNFFWFLDKVLAVCAIMLGMTDHCKLSNFTVDFAGSDTQTSSIDRDVSAKISPRLCKMATKSIYKTFVSAQARTEDLSRVGRTW